MGNFNIGGGLLAAAGAVGGLGQGLAEVGREQKKEDFATKMDQMAQAREEAIVRLQQSGQQQLEGQRETHEDKTLAAQQGFQAGQTEKELTAQSGMNRFKVEHEDSREDKRLKATAEQNAAHWQVQKEIGAGHDAARIGAAKAAHTGSQKAPPPVFKPQKVTLQGGIDPVTKLPIPGRQVLVNQHEDGSQWVGINGADKNGQPLGALVPFNNNADDGVGVQSNSLARAPAQAVQTLLKNPLGMAPSGATMRDSFYNRFHYLPNEYLGAANAARQAQRAQSAQGTQGGDADTSGVAENEDPAESEADPTPASSQE